MGSLTLFQIILLSVLTLLFVGVVVAGLRGWSTRREAFLWGTMCVIAAAATWNPKWTTDIAAKLKIGRGTDLVMYIAVIMMMIGFWMTYMRLRHLRRELTSLVRHIAILEAHEKAESESKPAEDELESRG